MYEDQNITEAKAYELALSVVKLYKRHIEEHREYVLGKQLLRSATSVGANVSESRGGISDADFSAKLSIAYKEARETKYWLRLLRDSNYLSQTDFDELFPMTEEICKILYSTLRKMGRTK